MKSPPRPRQRERRVPPPPDTAFFALREQAAVYHAGPASTPHPEPWSHPWLDQLGLLYHRAIAEKIHANPGRRRVAIDNIDRWMTRNDYPLGLRRALLEWREALLREPLDQLVERMLDPSERGKQRRQNTPFPGILTDAERKAIPENYEPATTALCPSANSVKLRQERHVYSKSAPKEPSSVRSGMTVPPSRRSRHAAPGGAWKGPMGP